MGEDLFSERAAAADDFGRLVDGGDDRGVGSAPAIVGRRGGTVMPAIAKSEYEKLQETKAALLERCPDFPKILIVLGSGLGAVVHNMAVEIEIPFSELPHFKSATVEGHRGRLLIGQI